MNARLCLLSSFVLVFSGLIWTQQACSKKQATSGTSTATGALPPAVKAPDCGSEEPAKLARTAPNVAARAAAHRGLQYLTKSSKEWTERHKCFGCHVQAVTLEALTFGKHHRYDIDDRDVELMADALRLGVTAGGRTTGAAFQGQAWARYDQWINTEQRSQLLRYAEELIGFQHEDGSIPDDDARLPVTGGTMHTTYQAMQTWRQAYSRTADEKWLAPMRKAEKYLSRVSDSWSDPSEVYLQEVNHALLGLIAAGVGPGEPSSRRLQKILLERQLDDGGWGLEPTRSDALATGQTIYALKLAGYTDADDAIGRGVIWLTERQKDDGAWRTVKSGQHGAEKGEAMWAVLGLVTMDVMTVSVTGIVDGQHVGPAMSIKAQAQDNDKRSGGVSKVEIFVDDRRVAGACGADLTHHWTPVGLEQGKHFVDVVATNGKGQESRRRFAVYVGDVYLTEMGARFNDATQQTEVVARNIAPTADKTGKITLDIYAVKPDGNERGRKVFSTTAPGVQGPITFAWKGVDDEGKAQPMGQYIAELVMRDDHGKIVQRESLLFSHESEAAARKKWGEIEGQLSLNGGIGVAANSEVELVDEDGRVIQTVRSTAQGNYRFKNVRRGSYRVRAKKKGWKTQETRVTAEPDAPAAKADMVF